MSEDVRSREQIRADYEAAMRRNDMLFPIVAIGVLIFALVVFLATK